MGTQYENFHIFYFQKRIVPVETIRGNMVCSCFQFTVSVLFLTMITQMCNTFVNVLHILTLQLEKSALKIIGEIREAWTIFLKPNLHNFFCLFRVSISLSALMIVSIRHKIGRTNP